MKKSWWLLNTHRASSLLIAVILLGLIGGVVVTTSNYLKDQSVISRQLSRSLIIQARKNLARLREPGRDQ